MENKTKNIMVRTTKEEHSYIKASASEYGLSVSAFMRMLALRHNPNK
jgi:uncharacterized protein (DUF1778 family)